MFYFGVNGTDNENITYYLYFNIFWSSANGIPYGSPRHKLSWSTANPQPEVPACKIAPTGRF